MYCSKCGQNVGNSTFCSGCGEKSGTVVSQPIQSVYAPPAQPIQPLQTGPNAFSERLHSFAGSNLFLIAIVLITLGTLANIFMTFSWFSIFTLLFAALPLTAFWLLYGAAKSAKSTKSTLASMTLFKVEAIIGLVLLSILILAMLIIGFFIVIGVAIADYMGAFAVAYFAGADFVWVFVAVYFVLFAVLTTYIIMYYVSFLKMVNGIRDGIRYNRFVKIRGVKMFTVLTCIAVGIGALYSLGLIVFAEHYVNWMLQMLWDLPWYMQEFYTNSFGWLYNQTSIMIMGAVPLITYIGTAIYLVVLNKFNKSLEN